MDFRRRPSEEAHAGVERELAERVVGSRRMTGGIIAAAHRLTFEHGPSGLRAFVVLRQHHGEVDSEAGTLRQGQLAVPATATRPIPWRTLARVLRSRESH